ncbi:gonadotropin subunit beta-1-like [Engraulis encrasicolus]|uniref:gonadotropin subunit beta-1-like n=1 Tax=Engraulis encrasicolus TaxID=184585 RepID=UPI002FD639FA
MRMQQVVAMVLLWSLARMVAPECHRCDLVNFTVPMALEGLPCTLETQGCAGLCHNTFQDGQYKLQRVSCVGGLVRWVSMPKALGCSCTQCNSWTTDCHNTRQPHSKVTSAPSWEECDSPLMLQHDL